MTKLISLGRVVRVTKNSPYLITTQTQSPDGVLDFLGRACSNDKDNPSNPTPCVQ